MTSIQEKIRRRITGHRRGWVFTPRDFLDLGSRQAIDLALLRLRRTGSVRRLARGLYDYPRKHATLGFLTPSSEAIAQALAGRDRTRLQPSGAYAANILGLSEQVPAKVVFLTDGPDRVVRVGRQEIRLRHTIPRNMAAAGRLSGLLIQALRNLGQGHVTRGRIDHLRRTLPAKERAKLLNDLDLAPAWMHPFFRELAEKS